MNAERTVVGYARVSTDDQSTHGQVVELEAAGATRVFTEVASGARTDRPRLDACLDYCRDGDVLAVVRLDRLGRSLGHLIEVVDALAERGVEFRSLGEGFDTTTTAGRMLFQVIGAMAEMERNLIRERTLAGLAQARREGRVGGRPPVMTPDRVEAAQTLAAQGKSVRQIAAAIGVSKSTVARSLQ